MAIISVNQNPSVRELRQFAGIWFPLFWILAGALVYSATKSWQTPAALAAAGMLIGAIGLMRPGFMRPIFLIWIYAAFPIGWVISHLVLGIVFFGVVTPIGWLMRAAGYDPMRRRVDRSSATYWTKCEDAGSRIYYFRQY